MSFETLLIDLIDKMLGTSHFSLLGKETSFKQLPFSRKQVNNEVGVSVLSLSWINFSNYGFIAVKNIFHKFIP